MKNVPRGGEDALAQIARRAQTLAVVRIGARAEGIELWVAPEPQAEAFNEWIEIEAAHADLAVLRAVESLRARFLELGIEPEPARPEESADEVAPPEDKAPAPATLAESAVERTPALAPDDQRAGERAPTLRRAPRVVFGLGAAGVRASRAESVEAKLALAIRLLAEPKLSISLEAWLPLNESNVEVGSRSAGVRSSMFGASFSYRDRAGPLRVGAGVGCALAVLKLEGHSSEGFLGVSKTLYGAVLSARLHAELPLTRRFALRLEAMAGLSRPRPVIALADEREYWGQPLISGTAGFEWSPFAE